MAPQAGRGSQAQAVGSWCADLAFQRRWLHLSDWLLALHNMYLLFIKLEKLDVKV